MYCTLVAYHLSVCRVPRTHGLAGAAYLDATIQEACLCPIEQQSADRLPTPTSIVIFCFRLLFHYSSFICFSFFLFFFLPYYELVELGTTTLGRKLGIIFAQRLLLPSDGPKNAGVAAMKQKCRSVHRKMHRKWDDMPPNGISDANTPRKKPKNSKRGRMGKCIIVGTVGSSTNGAPLGWPFDAASRDL